MTILVPVPIHPVGNILINQKMIFLVPWPTYFCHSSVRTFSSLHICCAFSFALVSNWSTSLYDSQGYIPVNSVICSSLFFISTAVLIVRIYSLQQSRLLSYLGCILLTNYSSCGIVKERKNTIFYELVRSLISIIFTHFLYHFTEGIW